MRSAIEGVIGRHQDQLFTMVIDATRMSPVLLIDEWRCGKGQFEYRFVLGLNVCSYLLYISCGGGITIFRLIFTGFRLLVQPQPLTMGGTHVLKKLIRVGRTHEVGPQSEHG